MKQPSGSCSTWDVGNYGSHQQPLDCRKYKSRRRVHICNSPFLSFAQRACIVIQLDTTYVDNFLLRHTLCMQTSNVTARLSGNTDWSEYSLVMCDNELEYW